MYGFVAGLPRTVSFHSVLSPTTAPATVLSNAHGTPSLMVSPAAVAASVMAAMNCPALAA